VLSSYADVLSPPHTSRALVASVVGRLSLGMTGLALLILVKSASGSYAAAGLVSACYAVSFAAGAPARARSADRRGPSRVLRRCGIAHPLAFGLLVLLAQVDAPTAALSAAALLIGVTVPPLGAVMRALWGQVLQPRQLSSAYSLESVVIEVCFVLGPVLVAVLTVVHPAAGVLASGLVATAGALALAANPRVRAVVPHPDRPTDLAGPLVSPVVRACLLNVLWIGAGFGAIEVGVLAFVEEQGSPGSTAGLVLGVWSLGSMVGGLVYGSLHLRTAASRQLPVLVAAVGLAAALPVLAPGVVLLGLLLAISGSTIAPFSACNSLILGDAAPPGTVTEAFAWNGSMIFGGAAVGTALAGVLVDAHGARAAFVATAVAGALTLASAFAGLAVLRGHAPRIQAPQPLP
jgi:MFS family permease